MFNQQSYLSLINKSEVLNLVQFKTISFRSPIIKAIYFLTIFYGNDVFCQCLSAPIFPSCIPVTSSALSDGDIINTGTIKTVNALSNFSNITLNGGQLIICSGLTLSNLTINSGTVFINTTGTLNCVGGSNVMLGSGSNFYNNGIFNFSGHLILNANTIIVNNGTMSTPFNYIVIQGLNAYLVNNKDLTSGGFMAWLPSSPNCLCLGDHSSTTTGYFYNKTTNSVSVPIGNACLNVKQYASNDNIVTSSNGLDICVPSGISYSGPPNWGSANVINNCNICIIALSIQLASFDGFISDKKAIINWQTLSEDNNCSYKLERSVDGVSFNEIDSVNGAINSIKVNNYQIVDSSINPDIIYYYRLKQEDCNGSYSYSKIISLSYKNNINDDPEFIKVTIIEQIVELCNYHSIESIIVFNSLGQIIFDGKIDRDIDLANLSDGIFYIHILTKFGKIKTYKILKNNRG